MAAAGPAQPLVCALEVEPSTAPAAIVLLHDGQQLPQRELVGHPTHPFVGQFLFQDYCYYSFTYYSYYLKFLC